MGEYVQAAMSNLRAQYKIRQLQTLKEHVTAADKRLTERRRHLIAEQRAAIHFARADVRLRAINEAKFDPQEFKTVSRAVKKLEGILGQMKAQGGELHNVSRMVSSIVQQLNQFSGAGWWTKTLAAMKDSKNPVTQAAALEGLLKGGLETIEDILGTQGNQLKDDVVIADQGQLGQNIVNAMAKAFDPGRISSLSALGGGKVSQLFGTSGSVGGVIAKDLANITPKQLRALAGAVRSVETVAPQEVTPQAAAAASQNPNPAAQPAQNPEQTPPAGQQTQQDAPAQAPAAPSDQGQQAAQAPASTPSVDQKTIQNKAGTYVVNMKKRLDANDPKTALLHAVRALKALGFTDLSAAMKALAPAPQAAQTPATPQPTGTN